MTDLILGTQVYKRDYADQPTVRLVNRFFEQNPTNLKKQAALLMRPVTREIADLGTGRGRGSFSREGSFNDDLFVVSGQSLFRLRDDLSSFQIEGNISLDGAPQMAIRNEELWIADGRFLQLYTGGETSASATLTATANPTASETVTIGATTYTFVSTLTAANQVLIGGDLQETLTNLVFAVNGSAGAGSVYGTGTVANTSATAALGANLTSVVLTAIAIGEDGNTVATTETMANASFAATTMSGGVNSPLQTIVLPDQRSAVGVVVLAQHVIVLTSNSQRWYYIRPNTTVVGALDFYEAEQLPDDVNGVSVVGDNLAFYGDESTEYWYANGAGNADDPFSRSQGGAFTRGIVEGTACRVREALFVVGTDGVVYQIAGEIRPVSTPGIADQIRQALTTLREA